VASKAYPSNLIQVGGDVAPLTIIATYLFARQLKLRAAPCAHRYLYEFREEGFPPSNMSTQLLNTPSKHAFSISALIDNVWTNVADAAFKRASGSFAGFAKAAILKFVPLSFS
jgi:hypothetical protein